MNLSELTQSKFRNTELEYQLFAFLLRKSPKLTTRIQENWFSILPIRSMVSILKKNRVILTEEMLLQEVKRLPSITKDDEDIYRAILKKVSDIPLSHLTEKGAALLAKQLYELSQGVEIITGIKDILSSLKSFDLSKAKQTLRALGQDSIPFGDDLSGDWVETFDERLDIVDERAKRLAEGRTDLIIPTGITRYDRWIGGLLKSEGEFGVILGKSGLGKTALLINFAIYAYEMGFNVMIASGEMSRNEIQFRVDSHMAGIPGINFRTGNLTLEERRRWKRTIKDYRSEHDNFLETVVFPRHFTMELVEAEALRIQDKHERQIDLMVLDYLNLLEPVRLKNSRDDWKSQADAVWDFKGFIKSFNGGIAGWTAGQITDTGMEKEILDLSDTKYARAIGETAPIVVGIVQTFEDELEKRIQFQPIKMRNAKRGSKIVYLHPNMDLMRMADMGRPRRNLHDEDDDVAERKKPDTKNVKRGKF